MKILLRICLLAGVFVLAFLLALSALAQKTNSPHDRGAGQNSPAYERGYRQGLKDREDNLEPSGGDANRNDGADLPAYHRGYHAGFCHAERSKTGYYTGTYHDYGPPVIRNGYYGYNAPSAYCENDRGDTAQPQGGSGGGQSRVEYGGGG
jgi:hypothetical protein